MRDAYNTIDLDEDISNLPLTAEELSDLELSLAVRSVFDEANRIYSGARVSNNRTRISVNEPAFDVAGRYNEISSLVYKPKRREERYADND